MNAAFIGVTNIYNGAKNSYSEIRESVRDETSAAGRVLTLPAAILFTVPGYGGTCAIKSVYFFALGRLAHIEYG